MAVLKVIEVLSSSDVSWEDAASKAIDKSSKTLKNVRSAYVNEQSVAIKDDGSKEYRVNVKLTFELE